MELKERIKNKELSIDVLNAISTMSFPLLPEDYVEVLPYVYEYGDKTIKENVASSLGGLPVEIVQEILTKTDDQKILAFYFQYYLKIEPDPEMVIKILNNPASPEALFALAADCNYSEVLNFLVNNVSLLKKNKNVIPILQRNKFLDGFLKEKLKEYQEFGILGEKRADTVVETVKKDEEVRKEQIEDEEKVEEDEDDETRALREKLIEEAGKEGKDIESDISVKEEELEEEELTLYQKLLKMTVAQKIDRALKGSKEERTLLIRDSNKVVAMAVIQSPKITEQEVVAIAGMRNVHKDVLRYIGTNRQYLKKYNIILALVKNPKTPPDIALTLLNRISERDLKFLVRDRGISEFVRQAANRILRSRKK